MTPGLISHLTPRLASGLYLKAITVDEDGDKNVRIALCSSILGCSPRYNIFSVEVKNRVVLKTSCLIKDKCLESGNMRVATFIEIDM